jgi:tRNA (guanine-N7-)-methyltransferase
MKEEHRPIRSFVIRQGRMSISQRRALVELWDTYSLNVADGLFDSLSSFKNNNPVTIEIGFGMGDSLVEMAAGNPQRNFVGIEVHRPGIGHLLGEANDRKLENLKVYNNDSVEVLEHCITPASIDCVQIFFPDPWPKKRHHKRRLITTALLSTIDTVLVPGGLVHMATDWLPYAEEIQGLMNADARFESVASPARPLTKYERRGIKQGHIVTDIAARRTLTAS